MAHFQDRWSVFYIFVDTKPQLIRSLLAVNSCGFLKELKLRTLLKLLLYFFFCERLALSLIYCIFSQWSYQTVFLFFVSTFDYF